MEAINKESYGYVNIPYGEATFTPETGIETYTASVIEFGKCVNINITIGQSATAGSRMIGTISGLHSALTRTYLVPVVGVTANGSVVTSAQISTNGEVTVVVTDDFLGFSLAGTIIL